MGRRPDPPELKAAKGNPGRRKSRKEVKAEAERAAAVRALAAQPVGTQLAPPPELLAAHFARALTIWRELGPELERTNRLQAVHRHHFAALCIYTAEFWTACEDLAKNGGAQKVKTVAGGEMERDRPAVRRRAEALAVMMDGARHFGLTPREEYALFKDQATVARENPGLFGPAKPAAAAEAQAADTPTLAGIGDMSKFKSEPPKPTVQ